MLYDPKWEIATKPDIYALPTLIAWLEKQPAQKSYCYGDTGGCLLHQYLSANGCRSVLMGGTYFIHEGGQGKLPYGFNDTAVGRPRTFGAALARAREFAAHAEADSRADRRG